MPELKSKSEPTIVEIDGEQVDISTPCHCQDADYENFDQRTTWGVNLLIGSLNTAVQEYSLCPRAQRDVFRKMLAVMSTLGRRTDWIRRDLDEIDRIYASGGKVPTETRLVWDMGRELLN